MFKCFLFVALLFACANAVKEVAKTAAAATTTDALRLELIHELSSSSTTGNKKTTPQDLERLIQSALAKVQRAMRPELPPVAVVGGGLSGLTASLHLLEAGVRVALIDKRLFWGGNSAKASSGINGGYTSNQEKLGIEDSADQFYKDTMACSGRTNGSLTERLIRRMADDSDRAVSWIESHAQVDLPDVGQLGGHSNPRTHRPRNRLAGAAFISGLERAVLKYRDTGLLQVLKGHRMVNILPVNNQENEKADDNSTHGLWDLQLEVVGGSPVTVRASSVILATGGYANDKDGPDSLLKEVTPHLMNLRSTNGEFATGDGIKVARKLGAGTIDLDMVQVHPTGFADKPIGFKDDGKNPNSPLILCAEILRGVGSVILNSKGERFVNELQTRKFVVEEMNKTGEKKFVLVLPPESSKMVEAHVKIYTGKGLLTPVDGINGVKEYVQERLHGTSEEIQSTFKETTEGTHPIKRNRPTKLPTDGTYYVGVVQPVLHYTMGGLAVDTDGRVMDKNGIPMNGLYGAGEIMGGVHGENRLGGSSLLDCVVYGLASAEHILNTYPELASSGFIDSTSNNDQQNDPTGEVVKEPPVKPDDQIRVQVEDRYYDLSRFVDLHPGGALLVEKGEVLTERFKEAHGDDWNLFERAEITQVSKDGHGVSSSEKKQVKEHRTANYGSKGGSWREIVGRRTWFFLHSVAAKYPDNPSENDKESIRNLVAALGQHYPCKLCRKHLKQQLRELRPIAVNTRQELTVWFCELHNMVNKDIGHQQFDCNPFHLDMEYLKDCGECEVVKNDGSAKSLLAEKAKSGYHPETGPWDSSLYQRDPLLLSSITSVTDAWEAKEADDMLTAMYTLGVIDKKKFQTIRERLRMGADERNNWLDTLTDAVTIAKKAIMKDGSGKDLNNAKAP